MTTAPPQRTRLTREGVLRAAVSIADEGGIESLSMRRLGAALGVEAMSLYNHVAGKEDILDGIIELVVEEFELPADGADWKSALSGSALSEHAALLRHRWAPSLIISRTASSGPARWRHSDAIVRTMRRAGFSTQLTHHAFHVLDCYTVGFTVQEVSTPDARDDWPALAAGFLRDFPRAEYPHFAEHVAYHVESGVYDEGDFEFGLDLILDGVERIQAAQTAPADQQSPRARASVGGAD
jgi:AcrR family transcriptional regulator